jgi:preprotein translocase subunit SecB
MAQSTGTGLSISQIILSAVEFKHRSDALQLPANTRQPTANVDVEINLRGDAKSKAAALAIRVKSRSDEDPLYHLDITMLGIVESHGESVGLTPHSFLVQGGVSMLFPFVREVVANITMRGRFGPIWLNPINVRAFAEAASAEPRQETAKTEARRLSRRKKAK